MIVVLLPVIDVLPWSAVIITAYAFHAFVWRMKSTIPIDKELLRYSNIWFGFAIFGVSIAFLFNHLNSVSSTAAINYLIRVILIYVSLLATNVLLMKWQNKTNILERFASLLFTLIIVSAFFEFGLKTINKDSVLSLFKARQDLGGIDTLHFDRFSGFWSYPGDVAAVIVLSIVLTLSLENKFKTLKLAVLIGLLLFTQSKAGIALLLAVSLCHWIIKFKILYLAVFLSLSFFIGPLIIPMIRDNFIYYNKFISNIAFYLEESKRASEILLYLNSDFIQLLVGLKEPYSMYESELIGSFSRIGLIGSLWILVPIFHVYCKLSRARKYHAIWMCLFGFLTVYLTMSAGMSRFKILIPYLLCFFAVHMQEKYCRTDKQAVH